MRWAMRRKVHYTKKGDEVLMKGCSKQSRCGQVHQDDREILQCERDEDPRKRGDKRVIRALSTDRGEIM